MECDLLSRISDNLNITEDLLTPNLLTDESLIVGIDYNTTTRQKELVKLKYTIVAEDRKRLNNKGILKVYNIDQPIEIPVTKLLGKWKVTHVGITVVRLDSQWQIEGDDTVFRATNKTHFRPTIRELIARLSPLQMVERLMHLE